MRKSIALALFAPLAVALFALLASAPGTASAAEPKVLDGKQIFLAQKCNLCHAVSSAGIQMTMKSSKAPDIAGAVVKKDAQAINNYLRKKTDMNGKKHPKDFTGSDEELGALIAWLQTQEKK
jgi:mono/diheme cytochrome c family protein